ncbi:MAG TPA: MerR family transcriptional regulator [Dehalococcoidia bacterium]|nr:MerR family transcriptional regulator [Dehalococcoidia bacterium]
MSSELTIGAAAKQTGLSTKTIRFYEDEGLVPVPRRSESGYRLYSEADVIRLQLVSRARLLGLNLPAIRNLVKKALSADCATFGDELRDVIARQRAEVESRLRELTALRNELSDLEGHVEHCCGGCDPATMAAECSFCGLIEVQDEDGVSIPREGR